MCVVICVWRYVCVAVCLCGGSMCGGSMCVHVCMRVVVP